MVVYCVVFCWFIMINEWIKKLRIVLVCWNFVWIVYVFVLNVFLLDNIRICVEFWKILYILLWFGVKLYWFYLVVVVSLIFVEEIDFICGFIVLLNCLFWWRFSFVMRWIYWFCYFFKIFFNIWVMLFMVIDW